MRNPPQVPLFGDVRGDGVGRYPAPDMFNEAARMIRLSQGMPASPASASPPSVAAPPPATARRTPLEPAYGIDASGDFAGAAADDLKPFHKIGGGSIPAGITRLPKYMAEKAGEVVGSMTETRTDPFAGGFIESPSGEKRAYGGHQDFPSLESARAASAQQQPKGVLPRGEGQIRPAPAESDGVVYFERGSEGVPEMRALPGERVEQPPRVFSDESAPEVMEDDGVLDAADVVGRGSPPEFLSAGSKTETAPDSPEIVDDGEPEEMTDAMDRSAMDQQETSRIDKRVQDAQIAATAAKSAVEANEREIESVLSEMNSLRGDGSPEGRNREWALRARYDQLLTRRSQLADDAMKAQRAAARSQEPLSFAEQGGIVTFGDSIPSQVRGMEMIEGDMPSSRTEKASEGIIEFEPTEQGRASTGGGRPVRFEGAMPGPPAEQPNPFTGTVEDIADMQSGLRAELDEAYRRGDRKKIAELEARTRNTGNAMNERAGYAEYAMAKQKADAIMAQYEQGLINDQTAAGRIVQSLGLDRLGWDGSEFFVGGEFQPSVMGVVEKLSPALRDVSGERGAKAAEEARILLMREVKDPQFVRGIASALQSNPMYAEDPELLAQAAREMAVNISQTVEGFVATAASAGTGGSASPATGGSMPAATPEERRGAVSGIVQGRRAPAAAQAQEASPTAPEKPSAPKSPPVEKKAPKRPRNIGGSSSAWTNLSARERQRARELGLPQNLSAEQYAKALGTGGNK
jgi:hypothetical protein